MSDVKDYLIIISPLVALLGLYVSYSTNKTREDKKDLRDEIKAVNEIADSVVDECLGYESLRVNKKPQAEMDEKRTKIQSLLKYLLIRVENIDKKLAFHVNDLYYEADRLTEKDYSDTLSAIINGRGKLYIGMETYFKERF
jgi:hypothetical protein